MAWRFILHVLTCLYQGWEVALISGIEKYLVWQRSGTLRGQFPFTLWAKSTQSCFEGRDGKGPYILERKSRRYPLLLHTWPPHYSTPGTAQKATISDKVCLARTSSMLPTFSCLWWLPTVISTQVYSLSKYIAIFFLNILPALDFRMNFCGNSDSGQWGSVLHSPLKKGYKRYWIVTVVGAQTL